MAGLLAAHWGNSEFAPPTPFASMVLAAQEHDNGWWDWEIKPTLNAQGYPLDYINSAKFLREVQDETNGVVKPYPFGAESVDDLLSRQVLPNRSYSNEDFLGHFYKAERINITYTLHSPKSI